MPTILKNKKAMILIACAVCLIVTASLGLFVHAERQQNPDYQLSLGQKFLSELKYEEAVLAFTRVIGIDPANMEAYLGMAEAYKGLEDYEEVIRVYTQALGVEPGNETAHRGLIDAYKTVADRYYEAGDYEQAISYYEKLIELEPGSSTEYYENLADAYFNIGDIESAIAVLDKGYEFWPSSSMLIEHEKLCRLAGIPSIPLTAEQEAYCQQLFEALRNNTLSASFLQGLYSNGLDDAIVAREYRLFYGDTINGTGMVLHSSDQNTNSFMLLFSDWRDGIPEGPAYVLIYGQYSLDTYVLSHVTVEDGRAQGLATEIHYDDWMGETDRFAGNARNGYWDGEVMWTRVNEEIGVVEYQDGKQVRIVEGNILLESSNLFETVYMWGTPQYDKDYLGHYMGFLETLPAKEKQQKMEEIRQKEEKKVKKEETPHPVFDAKQNPQNSVSQCSIPLAEKDEARLQKLLEAMREEDGKKIASAAAEAAHLIDWPDTGNNVVYYGDTDNGEGIAYRKMDTDDMQGHNFVFAHWQNGHLNGRVIFARVGLFSTSLDGPIDTEDTADPTVDIVTATLIDGRAQGETTSIIYWPHFLEASESYDAGEMFHWRIGTVKDDLWDGEQRSSMGNIGETLGSVHIYQNGRPCDNSGNVYADAIWEWTYCMPFTPNVFKVEFMEATKDKGFLPAMFESSGPFLEKYRGKKIYHGAMLFGLTGTVISRNDEINSMNNYTHRILQLDEPFHGRLFDEWNGLYGEESDITEVQMQIISFSDLFSADDPELEASIERGDYSLLEGKHITVDGDVMFANTGHHLTPVLLYHATITNIDG